MGKNRTIIGNSALRPPILIVEDDPSDRMTLEKAFTAANINHPIIFFPDGPAVLEYLGNPGAAVGLLLLDLKIPKMDGFEILRNVRSNPKLQGVVVVVLSGSRDEVNVRRAYDYSANSFLVKPETFEDLVKLIIELHNYWFHWNEMVRVSSRSSS